MYARHYEKESINIPIIMLTAKGDELDKVLGLEIGADDYMTNRSVRGKLLPASKPFLRRSDRQVAKMKVKVKMKLEF